MAETSFINGIYLFCIGIIRDFGRFRKCKRYHRIYYARVGVGMLQHFQQSHPAGQDMETRIQIGQPYSHDSGINSIGLPVPGSFRIRACYYTC